MHRVDDNLKTLVDLGQTQGFLTFTQVNEYLPDEAVNPEKLDHLLMSLEEFGLEIRADAHIPRPVETKRRNVKGKAGTAKKEDDKSDEERLAEIREQSARGRERSANRPMDRMPSLTEDGAMRFLDFWESDVEKASTPKEQGQIVRFLGDVRKRFGG